MRIGIDFDNTIVCYDRLIHRLGREVADIPADLPPSKVKVRDYLRAIGREDTWTEMQGLIYGARMAEAEPYPGVVPFLAWARAEGLTVFIVSHKTRRPFRGPPYNLHQAARDWVAGALDHAGSPLIPPDRVLFEPTKEEKLRRIAECDCTVFIDDLPEILQAPGFPVGTRPILFDPDGHHSAVAGLTVLGDWPAIRRFLEDRRSLPC